MTDPELNSTVDAESVRVITILGHVDHGKTTFVDSLLAANNIISTRMAGKIRYLDSREDEQERGITMESSAISLRFQILSKREDGAAEPIGKQYVVNLIDTPGHVDFSSEVSTASRICDGAIVLVDVVEGVCTQTITVLRQVWADRIKPILVINKMDRLITELKLDPLEAYHHLTRLLENVNAVIGGFYASERMEQDYRWREEVERKREARLAETSTLLECEPQEQDAFEEQDDKDLYFSPDRGNVIFASAVDGWGFRLGNFARIFAARLGTKERILRRVLWGDYYIEPKTKRIIGPNHLRGRNYRPLFVQLVLDNLWAVYENVLVKPDPEKILKIVTALDLSVPHRELTSKDSRIVLTSIFSRWLPLAATSIQAVVEIVPSPVTAQGLRIPQMLLHGAESQGRNSISETLKHDLYTCSRQPEASVVVYVSKMFAASRSMLTHRKVESAPEGSLSEAGFESGSSEDHVLGFARIYSGVLRVGMKVHAVLPKYNNNLPFSHPHNVDNVATVCIDGLYTMMGRELVPIAEIQAGNVFAISGIKNVVWRNATLCRGPDFRELDSSGPTDDLNTRCIINLGGAITGNSPILRVALETREPAEMPKLVKGLKLLSQSDPCVETFQQHTGEHVILTAGEIHLEGDLRERFAKTDVQVSEPIVPFRETVSNEHVPPSSIGSVHHVESEHFHIKLRVLPLPENMTAFLKEHTHMLGSLVTENNICSNSLALDQGGSENQSFWQRFNQLAKGEDAIWHDLRVWSFGPGKSGPNVLIDKRMTRLKFFKALEGQPSEIQLGYQIDLQDLDNSIESGFQSVTLQGPLCSEPLEGFAFFIEELGLTVEAEDQIKCLDQAVTTDLHISCLSAMKEACRLALIALPLRLMLAVYKCEVQTTGDVLGKVYDVIARRRGQILSEEVQEGTNFFRVQALLPVVESFGIALEIRKKTSGAAYPQLFFAGYKLLDLDPFWMPHTAVELEDLGEKADKVNIAKVYMDGVRARKGLFVDKKLVSAAEKQRTLKH